MAIQSVKVSIDGIEYFLTYNDGQYETIIPAPPKSSYTKTGHYYPISVSITDETGNTTIANDQDQTFGNVLRLHVAETVAPIVNVTYPEPSSVIADNTPTIIWVVTDDDSGINPDTIGITIDTRAKVTGSAISKVAVVDGYGCAYTPTLALEDGSHTIIVDATDYDGNAAANSIVTFTIDTSKPVIKRGGHMYHSIQIIPESFAKNGLYPAGDTEPKKLFGKNTWDDWHLIPSTRPLFNPPSVKTNYIDVPGMNGSIDLSTVLSNDYPVFGDRTGSQEFYVMNGYSEWYNAYSDIMNYCHGKKVLLVLDDEPSYFYVGRISVNSWKSDKDWSKITLDYTLEPYKYELYKSVEDLDIINMDIDRLKEAWRWNPFSFVEGIIYPPREFGDPTFGTIYDFQVFESTSENFIEVKLKDRTYPSCPAFELTNLGGNNCKLTVNLYYYHGRSGQTELWTKFATQTFELKSTDTTKTFVGYNLILQDYSQKYGWKWEPKMKFGFICEAANQHIGAKIDFRRGKL